MSKRQKSDDTPAEAGPRLYFAGTKQYYTSVESFFQVVCDAQRKGKAKYWRKVTPRRRDNSVHLECQDCGNLLSALVTTSVCHHPCVFKIHHLFTRLLVLDKLVRKTINVSPLGWGSLLVHNSAWLDR